jgi:hypothetical protein
MPEVAPVMTMDNGFEEWGLGIITTQYNSIQNFENDLAHTIKE